MAQNRLKRSAGNKILGGLCGGLGEYFSIDPTIIRLIWIVAIFWMGIPAIIAYFIGLIVVSITDQKNTPVSEEPLGNEEGVESKKADVPASRPHLVWGWLIIGVGVAILMERLGYFSRIKEFVFPGALIIAGIWVLIKGLGQRK
jgi:phage shock protein C